MLEHDRVILREASIGWPAKNNHQNANIPLLTSCSGSVASRVSGRRASDRL